MSNMFRCLIITNYVKNFHELPPAQYYIGVEQGCLAIIAAQKKLFLATGDFDHVTTKEHVTIKKNTKYYCLKTSQNILDGEFAIQQVYRM